MATRLLDNVVHFELSDEGRASLRRFEIEYLNRLFLMGKRMEQD